MFTIVFGWAVFLAKTTDLSVFWKCGTYYEYHDWAIRRDPHNWKPGFPELPTCYPENDPVNALKMNNNLKDYHWKCFQLEPFFLDHLLAIKHWKQLVDKWPAHTPHLWSKTGCAAVEARSTDLWSIARKNHVRNPATDISMHIQHESWQRHVLKLPPSERPPGFAVTGVQFVNAGMTQHAHAYVVVDGIYSILFDCVLCVWYCNVCC
jgi:hypothetical protein